MTLKYYFQRCQNSSVIVIVILTVIIINDSRYSLCFRVVHGVVLILLLIVAISCQRCLVMHIVDCFVYQCAAARKMINANI